MNTGIFVLIIGITLGSVGAYIYSTIKKKLTTTSKDSDNTKISELYKIADDISDYFENSAHPRDMYKHDDFNRAVEILDNKEFSNESVIEYACGGNYLIACVAFAALVKRDLSEDEIKKIIKQIGKTYAWQIYFALESIKNREIKSIIGPVIERAQEWWPENETLIHSLNDFIKYRMDKNESPTFGNSINRIADGKIQTIFSVLRLLDEKNTQQLYEELSRQESRQIDVKYLNSIGQVWDKDILDETIVENDNWKAHIRQLEDAIFKEPVRSILLVGESGVGKTALFKLFARTASNKGWKIFEAGAAEILAGQIYIGELEERIKTLREKLNREKRIIWFAQNFHELLLAGQHRFSSSGILDMMMPFLETGKIILIGETQPEAYERLLQTRPRVKSLFEIVRVAPTDNNTTTDIARQWITSKKTSDGSTILSEQTLKEIIHLVQQFLGDKASPGNLLEFLKNTYRQYLVDNKIQKPLTIEDFYITLSRLTGLPRSIIDENESLDLEMLKTRFEEKVKGQSEAIDCLVERVAMIKAGLTDPTRPSGVFLFAGPTGTGKTEIVKTLTQFLFGSEDRMIRLDMSEFQTEQSLRRILGESGEKSDATALVNLIRKQPFSVILLDEFEKAHQNIWDLFLQVFDDGRLTDQNGNLADFRHSIIILTSNLGATIDPGSGIGFSSTKGLFSISSVEKSISKTFRREFINRLDRVVIFRPLSISTMREILYKELKEVLSRRGLRTREWAVEWDESAITFLLDKGFTADLGARPLKRAIERYLLSPIAITIVNHQIPAGDQFLFVRSDGSGIQVEFIDPDSEESDRSQQAIIDVDKESLPRLKGIILDPKGDEKDFVDLQAMLKEQVARIDNTDWKDQKQNALDQMAAIGFWESENRYHILNQIEVMDRIEAGFKSATSIMDRLSGLKNRERRTYPIKLVNRLASLLYLLDQAYLSHETNLPQDAFLMVECNQQSSNMNDMVANFIHQIKNMYLNWAKNRRMQYSILKELNDRQRNSFCTILTVIGFGAYRILKSEEGLHVFEVPKDNGRSFDRYNVHIRVAAQPDKPLNDLNELLLTAENILKESAGDKLKIIRRYREKPSGLVRDNINNWRTGRIDQVFAGNFDLLS